eukprot:gene6754-13690_t
MNTNQNVRSSSEKFNDFLLTKLFDDDETKDLIIDFINSCVSPDEIVSDAEYVPSNPELGEPFRSYGIHLICTAGDGSKTIVHVQSFTESIFTGHEISDASKFYSSKIKQEFKYKDVTGMTFITIITDFIMSPAQSNYLTTRHIRSNDDEIDSTLVLLEPLKYNPDKDINGWCDLFTGVPFRGSEYKSESIIKRAYDILDKKNWSTEELDALKAYNKFLQDKKSEITQIQRDIFNSVSTNISHSIENVIVRAVREGFPKSVWTVTGSSDDLEFGRSISNNNDLIKFMACKVGYGIQLALVEGFLKGVSINSQCHQKDLSERSEQFDTSTFSTNKSHIDIVLKAIPIGIVNGIVEGVKNIKNEWEKQPITANEFELSPPKDIHQELFGEALPYGIYLAIGIKRKLSNTRLPTVYADAIDKTIDENREAMKEHINKRDMRYYRISSGITYEFWEYSSK